MDDSRYGERLEANLSCEVKGHLLEKISKRVELCLNTDVLLFCFSTKSCALSSNVKSKGFLIFMLGLLTSIGPLSIDMYLPSFGSIAESLNTTTSAIALSLSSFFIGLGVGQLFYGPLLERYGRVKPTYIGLGIYALSSLGCAFSQSVEMLIFFRFTQALGACGGMVASRAIVRDNFKTTEAAKAFSMLMIIVAVSPIIAPTLGGYISAWTGWRAVFIILSVLSILLWTLLYFFLPTAKPGNPEYSLKLTSIGRNYVEILRHPAFILNAIMGSIAYAGLYAYLSGSPHLYIETYGVSETTYATIFALNAIGLVGAGQINNLILRRVKSRTIVIGALIAQSIVGTVMFALYELDMLTVNSITACIFSYLFCLGLIFPNASALSLSSMGHTAGSASAMLGAVQMLLGAIASAIVSATLSVGFLEMIVVMVLCAVIALTMGIFSQKKLATFD